MSEGQVHRTHRATKGKKQHHGPNPKAFAYSTPGRYAKQVARTHDIKEKRLHVPLVDRLPDEAPPVVVGVVGPPGVGKSTLVKSLVRRYTKQTITSPRGPITVVTGKRRRLTIVECPADLTSMIDVSKVVDIVLLMIDGNYGFEMETMEFLNILSATGMPGNVFTVLTHLDLFKKPETLKAQKKRLRHRLWSELYQGAKLFYLSGVVNGRYPDREIHNLSRFLSVMKNPRPLVWRNSHPYCLVDRYLDITPPTNVEMDPKCDRTIAVYGYLRGTNFSKEQRVHLPGLGDLTVANVESLSDPCPTPFYEEALSKATGKSKRRRLGEKQKIIYAPMSDVGGVLVDRDAVYVDVKSSTFDGNTSNLGPGEQMVVDLHAGNVLGLDERKLPLFGRRQVDFGDDRLEDEGFVSGSDDDDDIEEGGGDGSPTMPEKMESEDEEGDVIFAESDSDLGSVSGDSRSIGSVEEEEADGLEDNEARSGITDGESALRWKSGLSARAARLHSDVRPGRIADLAKMLYNDLLSTAAVLRKWKGQEIAEPAEDLDDFFGKKPSQVIGETRDYRLALETKWSDQDNIDGLREKFAAASLGHRDSSDEGDGDFEDLETGETHKDMDGRSEEEMSVDKERDKNARKKEELKKRFEEEDRDGFEEKERFGEDEWYDEQKRNIQKQLDINKTEFEDMDPDSRAKIEGYRAGTYVKVTLEKVPHEFAFDPSRPMLMGGLTATEDRLGYVQVRIKRHRWHKRILKTNDPLIFSLGWRRFQTMPMYSISDSRTRNRMLKYTPEHMHCFGTFYGPLIAPNTGFLAVQDMNGAGFRVAATGVVLNVDESVEIVKKLKLTGTPYKIFKNTAFIKDMFTSALEIAKFEGASIKTVSGIRGQIKKALSTEGHFRATFEDKILMSDIVFLRAWYGVKPHRYYNMVTERIGWEGMRTTGQIRQAQGIPTPKQKNSVYRKVEREERHFNPLRVPRAVQAELPFKNQMAEMRKGKGRSYVQRRAVVADAAEKRARALMSQLQSIRKEKEGKRREKKEEKRQAYREKVKEGVDKKRQREKEEQERYWRHEGKKRKGWAKS